MEEKEKMKHNESCTCNDECKCNDDCKCDDECKCNDECKCDDDCKSNDNKKNKKHKKEQHKKYEETIEKLMTLNKTLEETALREKAEAINYRKRKDEEVSRMLKYANEDLVLEILPTLDNFERAIQLDDDNLTDELSKFLVGFKMIYCNLKSELEKFGVKAIDGCKKPFDPTYHQAVLTEHIDGIEPGMVIDVLQKGYLLKDKVIRTAMVKVSE